jgi:tether containing UBX domain for GLUT4
MKIIDNLLSRPNDPKVRSIRCANAAFEKKVGCCSGSYDFLYSIGFSPTYPYILGGMSAGNARPETLELTNESRETLLRGRKALIQSAVRDLGMEEDDLPPLPKSLESLPTSTLAAPPAPAPASRHNSRGPTSGFNVYKTHSHNIQSAAVGAPDPYSDAASTMSTTERQLQQLQSKKDKMEREMHSKIETDRGLVAFRAGSGPTSMGASTTAASSGGGKSDSSLVAARMKRMEEERKKREEGGFTTKAMRDLQRMKKAKVYSHAQIRVNFPDGTHLHAKFLPREKVAALRSVIESAFEDSLSPSLEFDLYVAPPRRLLIDTNTLEEEELVPAAKIHVSWKVGAAPVGDTAGCFVRSELFAGGNAGTSAFPDAKPVLKEKKAPEKSKGRDDSNGNDGAQSKEDLLMQRMLGKKVGLGRKSSSSDGGGNGQKKSGKPKWFKG